MAQKTAGKTPQGDPSYEGKWQEGPAAKSVVSLSQVLLAPLDAIFKAQVHAARSFLSLVLQLGYPHVPLDKDGNPTNSDSQVYSQEFVFNERMEDGKKMVTKAKLPVLSMVPVAPLAVENAEFDLEFSVSHVFRHTQIQASEQEKVEKEMTGSKNKFNQHKRPWFLVSDPVSIRGVVAPNANVQGQSEASDSTSIRIKVKIGKQPVPAALDKLLTSMTQMATVEENELPGSSTPPSDSPQTPPTPTPPTNPNPSVSSGSGNRGRASETGSSSILTDDTNLDS